MKELRNNSYGTLPAFQSPRNYCTISNEFIVVFWVFCLHLATEINCANGLVTFNGNNLLVAVQRVATNESKAINIWLQCDSEFARRFPLCNFLDDENCALEEGKKLMKMV